MILDLLNCKISATIHQSTPKPHMRCAPRKVDRRMAADNMATKQIKDYPWHQNAWNVDKRPAVAERRPGYIFCLEKQKLKGL